MTQEPLRLEQIATEARNAKSTNLDTLGSTEFVALMQDEDRHCSEAVQRAGPEIARALDAIVARMERGGRLVYCGAGTSGRLGVLDAVECPPTFSTPSGTVLGLIAGGEGAFVKAVEGAEDDQELGARDLQRVGIAAHDAVVGITASGRTPYVLGAFAEAERSGALRIAVVCSAGGPVAARAEIAITLLCGPEVLTGSTRLKAGTATKMVLNMLSTGAFVRLGKTYSNLMVDVQTTNAKLRSRARRIVAQATGLEEAAANEVLERCGNEVKTAIVAALRGVGPEKARSLLAATGGRVRVALDAP